MDNECCARPSAAARLGLSDVSCSHSAGYTSFQVSEGVPCTGFPLLRPGAGTTGVRLGKRPFVHCLQRLNCYSEIHEDTDFFSLHCMVPSLVCVFGALSCRLFRNTEELEKLSELGVLFLLFEMGLELSLDRLKVCRALTLHTLSYAPWYALLQMQRSVALSFQRVGVCFAGAGKVCVWAW